MCSGPRHSSSRRRGPASPSWRPTRPTPIAPFPFGTLRVVDAATGDVRSLPATGIVAFFWSPDGRRIATIGLATPAAPGAAWLDQRAGHGLRAGRRSRPASRRSATVPRSACPDPGLEGVRVGLQFIDVDAGTATPPQAVNLSSLFVNQVLPYFDQYALSHRVWSPDGASILLPVIGDDGTETLQVLPADGSAPRVLAPGLHGVLEPRRLVSASSRHQPERNAPRRSGHEHARSAGRGPQPRQSPPPPDDHRDDRPRDRRHRRSSA